MKIRKTGLRATVLLLSLLAGVACVSPSTGAKSRGESPAEIPPSAATATFAGGCFWCMEPPFEKLDGVYSVVSGYIGGPEVDPTYERVSAGATGHREAVQIRYDASRIDYGQLLDVFWRQIDPTDAGGQFADRGSQYQTGIFYHDDAQRELAQASKSKLARSGPFKDAIVTEILPAGPFYVAESYHQDYYKKNPQHYKAYRRGSGREGFLAETWGSQTSRREYTRPSELELQQKLSPRQYAVTRQNGTEPPFNNEYWDNHAEGLYVDVVSGEPLFSSTHKYESGTGWPSFTQPLVPEHIVEVEDPSDFALRTEVRSKYGDSHLGHLFPDGPAPTGLRYCVNSAALEFIPREQIASRGYAEYLPLFEASR